MRYTLTETTHYGDYRSAQIISGTDLPHMFNTIIQRSPFYDRLLEDIRDALVWSLARTGTAEHGWATYTLTTEEN